MESTMIELPIKIPRIQTVPNFTNGLAILYSLNETVADAWVANNCISITFQYYIESNFAPYLHVLPPFTLIDCCLFDTYRYSLKSIYNLGELIEDSLRDGFYIGTSIDVFYLPCHEATYHTFHMSHPILIYGIDFHTLKVADHFFTGEGSYSLAETDMESFLEGIKSAHEIYTETNNLRDVYQIRMKEKYETYLFSTKLVKSNLSQYLHSDATVMRNWPLVHPYLHHHFGYNALLALYEYFKGETTEYHRVHVRLAHELYAHILIIALVARQVQQDNLIILAESNVDRGLMLRNKLIKASLTKSFPKYDIEELLREIIESDYEVCKKLHDSLKE